MKRGGIRMVLASLALLGPIAAAGEPAALETRIFDLRQLVLPVPSRAGPVFSFAERVPLGEQALPDNLMEPGEEPPAITEDQIREAIEADAPEEPWGEGGTMLRFLNGRLLVRHRPEVLDRVGALLKALEQAIPGRVTVTAIAFATPFPGLPARDALAAAEGRELADRIRKGKGWWEEVTAAGTIDQRFYAVKGTQFLFLQEYDVEVAQNAAIHDPIMAVGETGLMLDARPVLVPSGESYVVSLRLTCSYPRQGAGVETAKTPGGQVMLPDIERVSCRSTLSMPESGWVLLGTSKGEPAPVEAAPASRGVRFLVTITGPGAAKK